MVQEKPQLTPNMESATKFTRPTLAEALDAWKNVLAERGFATDIDTYITWHWPPRHGPLPQKSE